MRNKKKFYRMSAIYLSVVLTICFFALTDISKASDGVDDEISIEETIAEIEIDNISDVVTEEESEECATVNDQMIIHIPSIEFETSYFSMILDLYENTDDPDNIYFSLNELHELVDPPTPCALMDNTLNIEINCIEINGSQYKLSLERYINPLNTEGLYWKVVNIGSLVEPMLSSEIDYPELETASTRPNLTPYKPSGWSSKIVVSNKKGTNKDSSPYDTDSLYIDWAVINNGTASIYNTFYTILYIDGKEKHRWNTTSLRKNCYAYAQDYYIGKLSAGRHTIKIKTDATGTVSESNGSDNTYTKSITVTSNGGNSNYTMRLKPVYTCWGWWNCSFEYQCVYSSNTRYTPCY